MNYRMLFYTLGRIFKVIGLVLALPIIVAFSYGDSVRDILSFVGTALLLLILGFALSFKAPKNKTIFAKEGIAIVGVSWILISFFGSLPFLISGYIPNFVDALFEATSGFTTTGASILTSEMLSSMSHSMLFWRSFTHWIGGMGVLVFILAVLPNTSASSIHLVKSESPGPNVSKLVSKVRFTAQILYAIYFVMSALLTVLLLIGGLDFFDSLIVMFGTAGTGGFALFSNSIAAYNSLYVEIVLTVFMFLFGVNFNLYYLILIGKVRQVLKSEELRAYLIILIAAIFLIAWNLVSVFGDFATSLRYASFQATSAMTSTGYTTTNVNAFPVLTQSILMLLMFIGASAGSTGGGFKVSRFLILMKSSVVKSRTVLNPRHAMLVKLDKKRVEDNVIEETNSMFILYIGFLFLTFLVISVSEIDVLTSLSASLSALSNIGMSFTPDAAAVPISAFPWYCKLLLTFDMLMGRLEIFPILMLFNRHTWSRIN